MLGVFAVVQEMVSKHIKVMPSQYTEEMGKITNYFKKRQFSVSYSMDIIYMLNWWGKFYAKLEWPPIRQDRDPVVRGRHGVTQKCPWAPGRHDVGAPPDLG